jgi:hypothetical protein
MFILFALKRISFFICASLEDDFYVIELATHLFILLILYTWSSEVYIYIGVLCEYGHTAFVHVTRLFSPSSSMLSFTT